MAFPDHADFVIIGAGIHGLSTAWRLAERLAAAGEQVEGRVVVLDKTGIAAGASGVACGVVRNNYFQPAMRKLMAHSVNVWESDPEGLSYHPVGYMQISSESMRDDVGSIYAQQQAIGYESVFVEGAQASSDYMKTIFGDWQAQGITSVLHEKRGGYSNQTKTMYALADKVEKLGVRIITGVTVKGLNSENGSKAVASVETDKGTISCERVIMGAGPWARDFWEMLGQPRKITVKGLDGQVHDDVDMWRFWQLEEGVLQLPPESGNADDGKMPPVIHVDTDAPLYSTVDGSLITDEMWGIYYKPDWHFGGIQGGASPYKVETPVNEVQIDPYLTADCRGNLRRMHEEFTKKHGTQLRIGTEPEMMWLKYDENGKPKDGFSKPYCYHIDQFESLRPVSLQVIRYARKMGLDMIQGDHEDAPGQLELNWMYDDVLRNADRLTTYRQICAQVAREHGIFACFMTKPFMGVSASGCHHNMSLWRGGDDEFVKVGNDPDNLPGMRDNYMYVKGGENTFMPDDDDPQMPGAEGLKAIGGVVHNLQALTAVGCSTVNSYRRLWDTGFWAPVFADWGFQTRTPISCGSKWPRPKIAPWATGFTS